VISLDGRNLVVFYYLSVSEADLIREVTFGGSGFIRGERVVVIGTECIGRYISYYHTFLVTTDPFLTKSKRGFRCKKTEIQSIQNSGKTQKSLRRLQ